MTTVVSGSYPAVNSDSDATINGLTVGRGAGAVSSNTAVGATALNANTTGAGNVAVGQNSLLSNTTANYNNAFGAASLFSNTTGTNNVAMGDASLYANTTGSSNTSIGATALRFNTTASHNTAVGYQAGYTNITGTQSTYLGSRAGYNATGNYNTIVGDYAGQGITTGTGNSFLGQGSGNLVTTGSKNTIIGRYDGNQGSLDIRTSSNNIVLSDGDGNFRGVFDASGNFFLGGRTSTFNSARIAVGMANANPGVMFDVTSNFARATGVDYGAFIYRDTAGETNAVTFVENNSAGNNAASYVVRTNAATGGTGFANVSGGVALVNGATSWSSYSDLRLKHDVKPITNATNLLLQIDPIYFKWNDKPETQLRSLGVSAQSVEKVFPELIDRSGVYDVEGGAMQVRYTELIPVLIASIQELNAKVTALEAQLGAK